MQFIYIDVQLIYVYMGLCNAAVDMPVFYHDIKFYVDMSLFWRYSTYLGWHTAYRSMSTCKILLVNADIQYINVDINLNHIGMQLNVYI